MEALKSYLYTAMLAALASSIVIRITDPRHRKYIRFGAGLCLLLLLTAPLAELTKETMEIADAPPTITAPADENLWMGEIGREMSDQIGDLTASRFSIDREHIRVKLTLDLADLTAISLVQVDLTITAPCDKKAIETYLSNALGCPVTVTTSIPPSDAEKERTE